jgi:hypothetical protein
MTTGQRAGAKRRRARAIDKEAAAVVPGAALADTQREHWSADAGSRDVVTLAIPPHAQRERSFEVFCRLEVSNKGGHADATHGLRVLVNGALEWSRNVPTQPGGSDSLDLRLRRMVPAGQALRVTASAETKRSTRVSLRISAEED